MVTIKKTIHIANALQHESFFNGHHCWDAYNDSWCLCKSAWYHRGF